jgi:simple sugar transport system ATP-binding protein
VIRLTDIYKSFGPVRANRGASLDVAAGEIHALVGENGAGKSTLMRILSGMFQPDAGRIEVMGRDVTGWHTSDAIQAGVGMVHQHFMLVPTLSVTDNVTLAQASWITPALTRKFRRSSIAPDSPYRFAVECPSWQWARHSASRF